MKSYWRSIIKLSEQIGFTLCREVRSRLGLQKRPIRPVNNHLIIAPLFLGDLFMLAPFIRGLRDTHPNEQIVLLCLDGLANLGRLLPVDEVISAKKPDLESRNKILQIIPQGVGYCYVFFAGAWLPILTNIPISTIVSYPDPKGRWSHLIDEKLQIPPTLTPLPELALRILTKPCNNRPPIDMWSPQSQCAVLHLGARNPARLLNVSQVIDIITALDKRKFSTILITGEASEGITHDSISSNLPENINRPIDLRGKLSLDDMPEVIRTARLLICVDTGIAHLSKALGTPTLVLLGQSQSALFGMDNLYSRSRHIAIDHLHCRTKHTLHGLKANWVETCNYKTCPLESRPCLPDPLPMELFTQIDILINETEMSHSNAIQ